MVAQKRLRAKPVLPRHNLWFSELFGWVPRPRFCGCGIRASFNRNRYVRLRLLLTWWRSLAFLLAPHCLLLTIVSGITSNVVSFARSASTLIDSAFPSCTNVADATAVTG